MSKTTFKVRKQRWDYFNRECKAMSLRRDDLINRLLPAEIALLANLSGCDAVGARWLKDRWVTMWSSSDFELVSVPVLLETDVVQRLNTVCAEKGVPRDAFVDCFLSFLTGRLVDAALVLKNPRTDADLGARVAGIMTDDGNSTREAEESLFEIASDWTKHRALSAWSEGVYEKQLSYDVTRVEQERLMLEAFELMSREA